MGSFKIVGGHRLKGEVVPQGAKNEALQILCAVLLTSEPVTIHNVPDIVDVNKLIDLLRAMGVLVEKLGTGSYRFTAKNVNPEFFLDPEYKRMGGSLRGSVMVAGPALARFGRGYIPSPGGDKIGRRRMDTHFTGFEKLGATIKYDENDSFYRAEAKQLKGSYMLLDEASVTGTANIVMAASLAEGRTTIFNAACEPYLQQLCNMLVRMGAKIQGIGSNLLHIDGVKELGGTEHRLLPDGVLRTHLDAVDGVVVAPGATQPQRVPHVLDPHRVPGQEEQAHPVVDRGIARCRCGTDEPARVALTAGERPSAVDDEAALDRGVLARRVHRPDDEVGGFPEQASGGGHGQVVRDSPDRALHTYLPTWVTMPRER